MYHCPMRHTMSLLGHLPKTILDACQYGPEQVPKIICEQLSEFSAGLCLSQLVTSPPDKGRCECPL